MKGQHFRDEIPNSSSFASGRDLAIVAKSHFCALTLTRPPFDRIATALFLLLPPTLLVAVGIAVPTLHVFSFSQYLCLLACLRQKVRFPLIFMNEVPAG